MANWKDKNYIQISWMIDEVKEKDMSPVFKTIINVSIWFLFLKGIMAALVTIYTILRAYIDGETTPMVGVASCAVGSFAFILTCLAIWLKRKIA